MADDLPDVYDLDRIAHMVLAMDPADVRRLAAGGEGGTGLAGPGHGDGRALALYPAVGSHGATVARTDALELVRRILDHRLVEGSLSEQQHDQMLTEAVVGLTGLL
ncbi:hypothetical protein NUM3379_16980 [Kineococcus sp. NUM-3379]